MGRESSSTAMSQVKDSINHIIASALSSGVRTIHIEPDRNFIVVRFRRGAKLQVVNKLPRSRAREFSAQLKKLANLDVAKTSIPQYGLTKLEIAKKQYQFQVATVPVIDGEKITIDVLSQTNPTQSLENIGLWGNSLGQVQEALALNHGLILLTSPQLKPAQDLLEIMFRMVDSHSHRLAYIGPIASQLPASVDIQDGEDVVQKLKSLQLGKYSIVGVGMVNSSALARQINDQVLKKQHIMAVLPASSALSALVFWQQMVAEPLALPMVISQHKVASLCPMCKVAYSPPIIEQIQLTANFQVDNPSVMKTLHVLEKSAIQAGLGDNQETDSSPTKILKLWRRDTTGCRHCNFSGYGQDIGIFEVLEPSDKLRSELSHKNIATNLQDIALSEGMISLKTDALVKALRGLIDFKTLISICSIAN
jgi:type II secretory ATPase GspE/PulE/Tfp pilus assembly ATPase PilB-like protein